MKAKSELIKICEGMDDNRQFDLLINDYANNADFDDLLLHALIFDDCAEVFLKVIH